LLETFVHYNDLCLEIEILQEQISLTEKEIKYWYSAGSIPLGSYGAFKYGANTALNQSEKKIRSLSKLKARLKELEESKERIDLRIKKFKGIQYQVAYKRYAEGKQLNEIADELNLSYEHIRRIHAKIKKNATPMLQTN
jgi:DNA-directed RNA polymerase specialized sigma subunit